MKKVLLSVAIIVLGLTNTNAQETKFGLTAGFASITEKAKSEGISFSVSDSGFFVGLFADITASEKLHIQPQVIYTNVSETSFLYIPVIAKYYVSEKFNLQVGPQANLFINDAPDEYNTFGLDLAFGVGYDINENFFLEARYGFEITNRYNGDLDITDKFNTLHVGLGYKF